MSPADGLLLALLLAVPLPRADAAPARLSLSAALAEARRANARLPVADAEARLAAARLREARARRGTALRGEGELWLAPAGGYDTTVTDQGDARLQIVAEKTLYDGGALRAREQEARADLGAARARYRRSVAEVDQEVRQAFAAVLAAEDERDVRVQAEERLQRWLDLLLQRGRAGEPAAAAILAMRVRLAAEEADRTDAERRLDQRSVVLAVLLGRSPDAALRLVAPPLPDDLWEPRLTGSAPMPVPPLPDLEVARHESEAASAALRKARADKALKVRLRADAGLWGADPLHPVSRLGADLGGRLRRDLGASLTLNVEVPLFATGGARERIAEARLAREAARRRVALATVEVNRRRELAVRGLRHAAETYRLLAAAEGTARDGLLDAESRYWGGRADYLEILDAHAALVDVAVRRSAALLAYRDAEASLARWGADS